MTDGDLFRIGIGVFCALLLVVLIASGHGNDPVPLWLFLLN